MSEAMTLFTADASAIAEREMHSPVAGTIRFENVYTHIYTHLHAYTTYIYICVYIGVYV